MARKTILINGHKRKVIAPQSSKPLPDHMLLLSFQRDQQTRKRFHISGLIYEASKREQRRSLAVLVRYYRGR